MKGTYIRLRLIQWRRLSLNFWPSDGWCPLKVHTYFNKLPGFNCRFNYVCMIILSTPDVKGLKCSHQTWKTFRVSFTVLVTHHKFVWPYLNLNSTWELDKSLLLCRSITTHIAFQGYHSNIASFWISNNERKS